MLCEKSECFVHFLWSKLVRFLQISFILSIFTILESDRTPYTLLERFITEHCGHAGWKFTRQLYLVRCGCRPKATWQIYQTKNKSCFPAGQESWLKTRRTELEMLGQMEVIILLCITNAAVLGLFFFPPFRISGLSLWKTHTTEDNECHVSLPLSTKREHKKHLHKWSCRVSCQISCLDRRRGKTVGISE